MRTRLEATGTPIGPRDTLIATQALALDVVTLVIGNLREFVRVPELRLVNWTDDDAR